MTLDEMRRRQEPPRDLADHMARLDAAHEAVRGQNKRGLENYDEAAAAIRELWASGEGQRRRDEWEQTELTTETQRHREDRNPR